MSDVLGPFHNEYEPDMWVVAAWNGSGTAMVFSSRETYEKLIADYEDFRVAHSLPWLHGKEAVNGDHILLMYEVGLRPWRVSLDTEGGITSVNALPLHHIKLQLVLARYKSGAPRVLEMWAPSEEFAALYARDLIAYGKELLPGPENDVVFDMQTGGTEQRTAKVEQAMHEEKKAPPTPPTVIPGFGEVVDLGKL